MSNLSYLLLSDLDIVVGFSYSGLICSLPLMQVGSIEGRVGVHHLDDAQQSKNFTFKCHRESNEIYSVNSLNFHPVRVVFSQISVILPVYLSYLPLLKFVENLAVLRSTLIESDP